MPATSCPWLTTLYATRYTAAPTPSAGPFPNILEEIPTHLWEPNLEGYVRQQLISRNTGSWCTVSCVLADGAVAFRSVFERDVHGVQRRLLFRCTIMHWHRFASQLTIIVLGVITLEIALVFGHCLLSLLISENWWTMRYWCTIKFIKSLSNITHESFFVALSCTFFSRRIFTSRPSWVRVSITD